VKSEQRSEMSREEILRRRAERLAETKGEGVLRRVDVQVALVGIGAQRVGIPAESLRELVPLPDITPLPGLPPWLLGIAQVRGELLGVVDLASIFGAAGEQPSVLVVVEGAGGPLGLAVQSVLGFRDVYEDELSDEMGMDPGRPIRAMTRDLVLLLDVERLPVAPSDAR
jgi:purine-binding chemotaxis protein CheW